MIVIDIKGIEEARARFVALAASLREEIAADAVNAAAKVILDAEKEDAPVLSSPSPGSDELAVGEIKESLKIRRRKLDRDGFALARVGPSGRRARHIARLVEYGHRLVKGKDDKAHEIGRVPQKPFLRPAFERSASEAVTRFKQVLREGIEGSRK